MKYNIKMSEVDSVSGLPLDELENGIYAPISDSKVRVIILDTIKLFLDDSSIEPLDESSWEGDTFIPVPVGNKTVITFTQD